MALVEVRGLVKDYTRRAAPWSRPGVTRAVDRVGFDIDAGDVFGLVGESGSGKTTVGRCLLRLVEPTSGEFRFDGHDVFSLPPAPLRLLRRRMQMIFQDPATSLDPRLAVGPQVEEGLVIHGIGTAEERHRRVRELFGLVGLDADAAGRFPREFSGGQRQRIGIARALALAPDFLIADEPVSALDVSIQAQIVNLLMDLRARLGLTLLVIAHDLRLVRHVCSRLAVMYRGRIVEMGETDAVFGEPAHPYTQALLSAIPDVDGIAGQDRIRFDPADLDPAAEWRLVAPGHWALARST